MFDIYGIKIKWSQNDEMLILEDSHDNLKCVGERMTKKEFVWRSYGYTKLGGIYITEKEKWRNSSHRVKVKLPDAK